jgi:drug/metabolite transporter (DMT)-like permease
MSEKTTVSPDSRWFGEILVRSISIGLFLVLIGIIFVINPGLWSKILDFFNDFTIVQVARTTVNLPLPALPAAHTAVYTAAFQFAFGIGILEILILALRLALGSRIRRTAQTVGDLVFWLGAAYILNILADMKSILTLGQQRDMWFQFWAAIIMIVGLSLIARAAILFVASRSEAKSKPVQL